MLNADLAELYGVETKVLNQAVVRNIDRFPSDFSYLLAIQEFRDLKSQFVTSSHGGRRALPRVFSEQGVAMLSSVLNSPLAVKVNVEIVRAFVRLRQLLATPGELVEQLRKLSATVDMHDKHIQQIAEVSKQMMAKPQEEPREIGFHTLHSAKKIRKRK